MVVGVDFDGLGEVANGLLVLVSLEGLVAFVLELKGLLVTHDKDIIILEHSILQHFRA